MNPSTPIKTKSIWLIAIFATATLIVLFAKGQSKPSRDPMSGLLFPPEAVIENRAKLDLSKEQVASIQAEVNTAMPTYRDLQRSAEAQAKALHTALQKPLPDETMVRSLHGTLLDAERAVKELEFQVMLKVRLVLTAEQFAQARSLSRLSSSQPGDKGQRRVGQKLDALKAIVEKLEKSGQSPLQHEAKLKQLQQLVRENNAGEAEVLIDELLHLLSPKTDEGDEAAVDLKAALQAALLREDLAGVKEAVALGQKELQELAGTPEVADEYLPVPAIASLLTASEARQAAKKSFAKLEQMRFWQIGLDPTQLSAPLRAPASVVACMIALHRAKLDDGTEALQQAKDAADFLIWTQQQAGAGCYPFPAAKNTSQERAMQVATRFLERAEAAGKLGETVRNGWAYEDHDDGGLQFDNGECGVAMFEIYEATQDERYLDSALKAADWAITRPLCTNWNYNSFSVHLLAKAHQVTKQPKYLEAALKKAKLGVIPGQLTDGPRAGRWMDPHNARPAYHYVMMTALARLDSELPPDHADQPAIRQSLQLGLVARNSEILTLGVMNKDKPIECLMLVQRLFATNPDFLAKTKSVEALDAIQRFVSEEARHGKLPLGPRGWGELLERCATLPSR